MFRTTAAAALALGLSTPVLAQTAPAMAPSAAMPAAAMPAAGLTELDRQFMILDAQGGIYESSLAALAQEKSSRGDIKSYAAMLLRDHAEYNGALQALAQAKGIALPMAMSADDRTRLNGINLQGGSTFDRSFILEATRINEEDKKAAQGEAAATNDPDIKAFLQKYAAMDARHEQAARMLAM